MYLAFIYFFVKHSGVCSDDIVWTSERVHDNLHTEQRETDYDLPWEVIHVYWECKPRV